jgi:hypothetical protein
MADRSFEPAGEPRLCPVRRPELASVTPNKWAELSQALEAIGRQESGG